jgi:hypothetical protein
MMEVLIVTLVIFGVAIAAMLIGQRASGRCLTGSCGSSLAGDDADKAVCEACPNRRRRETGRA